MEEAINATRYFIEIEDKTDRNRSMAFVIAGRKCYQCRQADTEESLTSSKPKEHITRIAEHCADTPDYFAQDTPLKEAIFREIMAGGNKPRSAEEISEALSARWAMSANPRDLSPAVVGKLLDRSQAYRIAAIPAPEPEPKQDAVVEKGGEGSEESTTQIGGNTVG